MKPSGPGLLFAGRFLITVSISVLVMGLWRFYISSWFSFEKLYFAKNLSISSKLSILLAYSCWYSLLWSFVFLCCLLWFLHSFLILLIWFFSLFFLVSLANGLSILCVFSKNYLLALLIFAMVFFVSFAFISACPNFYDFFPSNNPGVLHFFFF